MASVFIDEYHVYYSITDGKIHDFEKATPTGNWEPVENEVERIEVVKNIIKEEAGSDQGYSAFVRPFAEKYKIQLPEGLKP